MIPDASITTDIIVGFPGETEADFLETMRVVEAARFATAFTYQYSKRPGTPAADLPDQVPKEVVQERYERLLALVNDIAWQENKKQVGKVVEVLVATGEGRKDSQTHRQTGRTQDSRLVHFEVPLGREIARPGDLVTVQVTQAAPYHLLAEGSPGSLYEVRRTRGGDAHDRRELESCGAPTPGSGKVSLGIPIRSKSVL
jgi:tRNA-2-methylthio-N6-dimethylallyladenosine synthase